jgi:16S rRNA (cytidine1402-2'-O)-methyltransferase
MDDHPSIPWPSGLYVVATPIGNLGDMTLRAINTLARVDLIAAEDTRHTSRLLSHYFIRTPLISYHEHNEQHRAPQLIDKIRAGSAVALVSDAGTPSVSDPGYRLVRAAIENGLDVYPIPGVSAAVTALSASGLPTDSFVFVGFLPKKKGKRMDVLRSLVAEPRTLVFYESPRRVMTLLEDARALMGDRPAVLAREMTKLHEEFIRGRLTDVLSALADRPEIKGECTLLIRGATSPTPISDSELDDVIRRALSKPGARVSSVSKTLARQHGLPRKIIYELALEIEKETNRPDNDR